MRTEVIKWGRYMRFTREKLPEILNKLNGNMAKNSDHGQGLYRNGYRQFGASFWGWEPSKAIKKFIKLVPKGFKEASVLDCGAGTGKNTIEAARCGASSILAIEIDSIAVSHMLNTVIALEESSILNQGKINILKSDALNLDFRVYANQFDVVICYGLLHVIKNDGLLSKFIKNLLLSVRVGGYLIVQYITNKYPAPISQPELEGVITSEATISGYTKANWKVIFMDKEDIVHSHIGSEDKHKHGAYRAILKRLK